jgi:hypothetical protein
MLKFAGLIFVITTSPRTYKTQLLEGGEGLVFSHSVGDDVKVLELHWCKCW